MICAKCGANNPPESAYCGGCGSYLAPAPDVSAESSAPRQEPSAQAPFEPSAQPAAASVSEDMPTFHAMPPLPVQDTPSFSIEEEPTVRAVPAQPTPAASEFMNIAPATSQGTPAAPVTPVAPISGAGQGPSGPLAARTPGFAQQGPSGPLGAPGYPQQPGTPGISGANYPQQGQVGTPGISGANYPQQAYPGTPVFPAPGFAQQGQPGTPVFPSGALYPPNTPLPTPGAFPPPTPLPAFPSGALYPQQGQPGGVFPPATNDFPAGAYPGQPGQMSWPGFAAPGAVPQAQPSAPSKLIQPLPRWAFIGGIVVIALLLIVLAFFNPTDWAAGAQVAGIIALVLGVLVLIAFGVRTALGMLVESNPHRRAQIISSLLVTLLLIAVGAIGLSAQAGIHSVQAHYLEGQHSWQTAINEYQDGGQSSPTSEDIARTYNEWGELLVSDQQYADGIAKFEIVTSSYAQAPTGFAKAKSDAISAYQNWAQQAMQQQKYDQATQHYDKLLNQSYCDGACQTQISALDATAYDKLAEQKLNQQPPDYASAVAAFNQLTTRFSSSSAAQGAHADYAKALWGDGQQLLNTNCSSALTIYQQLSSQFSDTTQGQQATDALKQPGKVKGHFTSNIPSGNDVPAVGLTQGTSPGMTSDQFYAILAKSPVAPVKSDGTFEFSSVKQGSYYLVWGTINQTAGKEIFTVSQRYPAAVGPLCGFDFGDISEVFPLA